MKGQLLSFCSIKHVHHIVNDCLDYKTSVSLLCNMRYFCSKTSQWVFLNVTFETVYSIIYNVYTAILAVTPTVLKSRENFCLTLQYLSWLVDYSNDLPVPCIFRCVYQQ